MSILLKMIYRYNVISFKSSMICRNRKNNLKIHEEAQSSPTLCDPMDYTVHGIFQARVLEWVAFPFSRGSSQPRNRTQVSHIAGGFFTIWATTEALSSLSYSKFPLAIYFTYGNVYVTMLFSQFIPFSSFPTVPTSLFSMSASPLLPCKWVHQYHLSRFHMHALIYNICLFVLLYLYNRL